MNFKLCSLLKACVSTQFWQYKQSTSFCKRLVYSYPNLNNWLFFCLKHKRAQDSVFVMNNIKQQQTGLNRISETSSHLCPKEKKKTDQFRSIMLFSAAFGCQLFVLRGLITLVKEHAVFLPQQKETNNLPPPSFNPSLCSQWEHLPPCNTHTHTHTNQYPHRGGHWESYWV